MGCRRSSKEETFADELRDIAKGVVPPPRVTITTVRPDETHPPVMGTTVEMRPPFEKGPVYDDYFKEGEVTTLESQLAFFRGCVEPTKIRKVALLKFLKNFSFRDNKDEFVKYRLIMRQHKYDKKDVYILSRVISDACLTLRHTVNKAFEVRVSKETKETAYWTQAAINNYWLLLTNAIAEPVVITEFRNKELYDELFEV